MTTLKTGGNRKPYFQTIDDNATTSTSLAAQSQNTSRGYRKNNEMHDRSETVDLFTITWFVNDASYVWLRDGLICESLTTVI
jgi:hypothetical protein